MLSPKSHDQEQFQQAQFQQQSHFGTMPQHVDSGVSRASSPPPPLLQSVPLHPSQTGSFGVNHNSNYTTASTVQAQNQNSFSLPSVNQSSFLSEQQHQGMQQLPLLPPPSTSNNGSFIPHIHNLQQHTLTPYNGFPQAEQDEKPNRFFPYSQSLPYLQQPLPSVAPTNGEYPPYSFAASNIGESQTFPPPPPLNTSQSVPNIPSHIHHQSTSSQSSGSEDVPFPGVLDPHFPSNPVYYQRSATYPNDSSHKRISSTSSASSLLGMTPETAKRNRCSICQKQFKRPSSLQTHVYSHTGEKPFICNWNDCGRLFSVRSNMIRHRKLHERDATLKKEKLEKREQFNANGKGVTSMDILPKQTEGEQVVKSDVSILHTATTKPSGVKHSGGSLPSLLHAVTKNPQSEFQIGW